MEGNISRDLRKWREKADLTQEELAERVKVRRETVVHWENEDKPEKWPKEANCLKLSNILGVKVTTKGIIENHIMDMNIEQNTHDDTDWYRRTIDSLIHENGQAMKINHEMIKVFQVRDEKEIDRVWGLVINPNPPQNGQ